MSLNRRQVIELTAAIRARRDQLVEEIRRDAAKMRGEPYAGVAGAVHDTGDEALADVLTDTNQAELSRDVAELRELDAACKRLDAGTYGTCLDCSVDIDVERLFANPGVTRCVACQSRHEKTHATARHSSL
jgi:DnaK suppressor protein